MIIQLNTAKNNALEVREILRHSDKQTAAIIIREYTTYQGNAGYSGKYNGLIKELAIKACENKRHEIIKVIRDGIFEILDDDCGVIV